jgi:UDP-N-acetylmuramyl pentapeptide synthase
MPRESVTFFPHSAEAVLPIAAHVRRGDLVLVKGSRGTRTDLVADRLAAEFA